MNRRSAVTALAATALTMRYRPARAQGSLTHIRIAGTPTDAFTPVFYAIKNGLYAAEGLDVEYVPTSSGSAATAAVIGGTYEFGNTSLTPILSAHLNSVPIVVAVPQAIYRAQNPFSLLEIAPDSTIKKATDLNGKILGCFGLGDASELGSLAWVDKNGGDVSSLKFIEIPFGASADAVKEHRVDAMMLLEPLLDTAIAEGKTKTLADAYAAIADRFAIGTYIARPDWLAANTKLAQRFRAVTEQASAWVNGHVAETAQLLADATKIPLDVVKRMSRVRYATTLEPSDYQPYIDKAAHYKLIGRSFPASELLWNG